MQKAVAKYGLAAHLALLAVAPLFLFPFFGSKTTAVVLLWLSLYAAMWLVLSPSLLGGEILDDARGRILFNIVRDPVFWVLVAVVVTAGVRTLNTGIRVSFDYETAEWSVLTSALPFLPGSVEGSGFLPFAAALSASIVVLGCRHALGKSARMMFLLILSVLSGIAAFIALVLLGSGDAVMTAAATAAPERFSGLGVGFSVCFLCSASALFVVLEQDWGKSMLLLVVAIAGNAAASFAFLSLRDFIVFTLAYIVLLLFSVLCAWKCLNGTKGFKFLLVVLFSLGLACMTVDASVPDDVLEHRLSAFAAHESEAEPAEDAHKNVRAVLSDVASKAWSENIWTGIGIGAFRYYPRFYLTKEELERLPRRVLVVPNGWWHLLAERGLIGVVLVVLPFAILFISYLLGACRCMHLCSLPEPVAMLAPLAIVAVVFSAFYSTSMLRAEVLAMSGAILSISSKSFPKGDCNG